MFRFMATLKSKDPIKVVKEGLKQFTDKDLIIVDTSGRHKEEKDLDQGNERS